MSALPKRRQSELRLPAEVIEAWMEENHVAWRKLERGAVLWPNAQGVPETLTVFRIENLIAEVDLMYWAWLNLVERESVRGDDGEILKKAGEPWALFPVQAKLARIRGNLVVECASEIGKTRDMILRTLWGMDSPHGPDSILDVVNLDGTAERLWTEFEFQMEKNPFIGGGLVSKRVKPFRQMKCANGRLFMLCLIGHDGEQIRDVHCQQVNGDEAAKWKNATQWEEFWRSGTPGTEYRLYSTPDGDYSSPFYGLCQRAKPYEKTDSVSSAPKRAAKGSPDEPKFRKINVTKMELPPPFWSELRAAKYREMYGGESSLGWITKVLGQWGSPQYSVFPMTTLKPNLKNIPEYRMVRVQIDRENRQVQFAAARLAAELGTVEGKAQEEMLARDRRPFVSPEALAKEICEYFPSIADWKDPLLFCGGDLGSSQDPSEFLFQRVIGQKWRDVFRLHLVRADWPEQAAIAAHLDHASGHRAKYGFDSGSAGSALVQVLTQMTEFRRCPVCECAVYFEERLSAFGFGEKTDEIDLVTGEPLLNPDRKDKAGNLLPKRISNKELGTRILERKYQAREIEQAWDGGAGNERLSGPQLMVNHTTSGGENGKGERNFRGEDDHHVDSRRQLALAIVAELRGQATAPSPAPDNVVSIGARRAALGIFDSTPTAAVSMGRRIASELGPGW